MNSSGLPPAAGNAALIFWCRRRDIGMNLLSIKVGTALALLCLIAGTPLAFKELWDYRQIVTDQGKAQATKIEPRSERHRSRRGGPHYHYYAKYEFADEYGVPWHGEQEIDLDLYNILTDSVPDTKIRISYARHDPSLNAIDLNAMRKSSAIPVIIVVVLWALVVILYRAGRRGRREEAGRIQRALEVDHSISAPPPAQSAVRKFGAWRRVPVARTKPPAQQPRSKPSS
jgi:cbb3-type cytochrome oxidase subunit 3